MDYAFDFASLLPYAGIMAKGLMETAIYAALSILFGLMMGTGCALTLVYASKAWRRLVRCYVEFFRNTPSLVQLFLIYFGLPVIGLHLSPPVAGVIALSLYCGAYMTEILRAGLISLPRGLTEAGEALGLPRRHIISHVLALPALQNIFPALASQMVLTLIGTSLISQIGVEEIFHSGSFVESRTFRSFEIYMVICGLYFFAVSLMKVLLRIVWYRFQARR
ncbi:amino acid ABC transporter permease [Erwinia sp. JUb26]|uniref:amino acid ABC transporter permease n=1 Tax=Erwinia sp. JUb26 TaxID=2485126 RepID=UPI000F4A7782|nr:amino acid ABC transporter permease [Erwinia sp. JUb26]ROR08714.1 polar amino acid transport system permease protein [Erwinia sp. JUb26]